MNMVQQLYWWDSCKETTTIYDDNAHKTAFKFKGAKQIAYPDLKIVKRYTYMHIVEKINTMEKVWICCGDRVNQVQNDKLYQDQRTTSHHLVNIASSNTFWAKPLRQKIASKLNMQVIHAGTFTQDQINTNIRFTGFTAFNSFWQLSIPYPLTRLYEWLLHLECRYILY